MCGSSRACWNAVRSSLAQQAWVGGLVGCGAHIYRPAHQPPTKPTHPPTHTQCRCYLKRSSGWGMKQVTNMQSAIMPGRNDSAGRNPTPTPAVPPPVVPPPVVPAPPAVVVPSPAPPSTTPKPDPPTQQTPGYPRINHGLLADGSEPTVLESLGTSRR